MIKKTIENQVYFKCLLTPKISITIARRFGSH